MVMLASCISIELVITTSPVTIIITTKVFFLFFSLVTINRTWPYTTDTLFLHSLCNTFNLVKVMVIMFIHLPKHSVTYFSSPLSATYLKVTVVCLTPSRHKLHPSAIDLSCATFGDLRANLITTLLTHAA